MRQKLKNLSYPILAILIVGLMCEALGRLARFPEYFLPLPSVVAVEVKVNAWLLVVHGWVTTFGFGPFDGRF